MALIGASNFVLVSVFIVTFLVFVRLPSLDVLPVALHDSSLSVFIVF